MIPSQKSNCLERFKRTLQPNAHLVSNPFEVSIMQVE